MSASDKSPSADVYAGDTASPGEPASDGAVHVFTIEADAEPGTFARIANVLNIANTAPRRVSLEHQENGATLSIQVELAVGVGTAQSIQRKLAQLTDVIRVDWGTIPR
jgi:hypothetical protein